VGFISNLATFIFVVIEYIGKASPEDMGFYYRSPLIIITFALNAVREIELLESMPLQE